MASANIPCLKPTLCGVQSHRPGTIAKCRATTGKSQGSLQQNLTKAPGLSTSNYSDDELSHFAADPHVSDLLAKYDKAKEESDKDLHSGRKLDQLRMIRGRIGDRLGDLGVGEPGFMGEHTRSKTALALTDQEREPDPNGFSLAAVEGGMHLAAKERPTLAPYLQKVWEADFRPILAQDVREGAYVLSNDDIVNGDFQEKPGNKVLRIGIDEDDDNPIFEMGDGESEEIGEATTIFVNRTSLPRYYDYSEAITGG